MAAPKIRFKRDDGSGYPEWETMPMSDIFSEIIEKNHPEMPALSVQQGTGTVLRDASDRNIQYDRSNLKNYKVIQKNDFIIHLRSFEGGLECSNHDGISSPAYRILRPKKFIPAAYKDYFRSYDFIHNKLAVAVVGIRDGKNIDMDTFWQIPMTVASVEEQQKIADFLSSVDEVIAASEQEVANLETQKKAVMKKIFSQEVRFKREDGTDFPEWEEKHLSDVSQCLDNQRIPINATERAKIKGNIPYYGAGNIQGYINKFLFDEDLVLLLEDGDAFDDFGTKSISQFVSGKCWINNHAHVLRPLENPYFLHCVLSHKDIRQWTQLAGQSRKKLTQENMMRITLEMPCLEEQRLIADVLSNFDEAISAAKNELELWKQLKKGLLQQMFV